VADSPESLQAILRRRADAGFVGRAGELALFRENLGNTFIFNVYGDGGVGKSALLGQWRRIAREAGAAEALIDQHVFSAPEAMSAVLDQLGRPREARQFRARYATFLENRQQPQFLATKVRDPRDARLMLDPTDELGPLFAEALRRIAAGRPVVLFFDSFEQSGIALEDWLLDLMSGAYGELPATLTVVIAGRLPLDGTRWIALRGLIASIPLTVFTEAETRRLLAANQITDGPTVDRIMSLSGRLPLLVDLLAKGRPAMVDEVNDPADTAIERFLKWEPEESRRQAALAGALPRHLDEGLFGAALGRDDVADLFAWLIGQVFVGGDRYHEVVRAQMLRSQRRQSPRRWREAHARLAAACRERRDLAGATPWKAEDWQTHQLEAIYHGLCAHELTLDAVLADAVPVVAAGVPVARRWTEVIVEAGRDGDDAEVHEVGRRLVEATAHGEDAAVELLTCLLDLGRTDRAGRARLLLGRAGLRYYADVDEQAIEDCTRAIELDPGLAPAYALRASAKRFLGRGEEALADFDRAIELDPDYLWAIACRGECYRMLNRYPEALADFDRALALDGRAAWVLGGRGSVHRRLNQFERAVKDLTAAIELDDNYAWVYAERGWIYRLQGRYDEAITDLNRSIELNGSPTGAPSERVAVRRNTKRYDPALAGVNRAAELRSSATFHVQRGILRQELGQTEEAEADFRRARELDPSLSWRVVDGAVLFDD
jgi:tetratricopeptide (TPR) repeat protein